MTQTLTTTQKFDINILIQCLFSFSSEEILKLVCTFPTLFHVQTFFMYLHTFHWFPGLYIYPGELLDMDVISQFDFALWYLEILSADCVQSYILEVLVCLIFFFLRYADKCVLKYSCLIYVKFKDIVNILLILLGTK